MNRPDDELDNLFRNHLAAGLDPMRGQAGRAFAREVTGPMRRRLRIIAWHGAWQGVAKSIVHRARPAAAAGLAMAACMALGFFVPRWWATPDAVAEAGPVAGHFADAVAVVPEARGGFVGSPVESASFVDPQTHARTEYYLFPSNVEVLAPAGRQ